MVKKAERKEPKFDKREYDNKYKNTHYTQFKFRLKNIDDADVIEKLKSIDNKPEYFRLLIRADIQKNK